MSAIGAVDVALWDIKGNALNTPVYNLLGGRSRDGVLVCTHANGRDVPVPFVSTWTKGWRGFQLYQGCARPHL